MALSKFFIQITIKLHVIKTGGVCVVYVNVWTQAAIVFFMKHSTIFL